MSEPTRENLTEISTSLCHFCDIPSPYRNHYRTRAPKPLRRQPFLICPSCVTLTLSSADNARAFLLCTLCRRLATFFLSVPVPSQWYIVVYRCVQDPKQAPVYFCLVGALNFFCETQASTQQDFSLKERAVYLLPYSARAPPQRL